MLKEEYLNFLINEKTNFADLDKVESHYQSQIITQYSTYNANKTIIEEKAKEYNRITTQIETALVSRLDFSQNDFYLYYKKVISEINKAIRLKEHELECYRKSYKRLYKSNYLLKKKYEEEMKIQNLNDEQHEKYNIIKNHAILTITNQNTMLNNMKLFYELSTMTYSNKMNKKTKKFNELEFQVMMIKKDTKDIEEIITRSKIEQIELRKTISNQYNYKLHNDYMSLFHDYAKIKIKLFEIYEQLKVKNLNDIITKFNLNLNNYQMLSSLFALANNDIVSLNNNLTKLIKEKNDIDTKLNENHIKINKDSYDFITNKAKYNETIAINEHLSKNYSDKVQRMKLLIAFFVDYIIKMQDSMRNSSMPNFFSYPKIFGSSTKNNLLLQYQIVTKNKSISVNFEKMSSLSLDKNLIQFMIYIMNTFSMYLYLVVSNSFNYICEDSNGINTNYEIITLSSSKTKKGYDKCLQEAFIHNENKEKLLKRSDREIFILKEKEVKNIFFKETSQFFF